MSSSSDSWTVWQLRSLEISPHSETVPNTFRESGCFPFPSAQSHGQWLWTLCGMKVLGQIDIVYLWPVWRGLFQGDLQISQGALGL